MKKTDSAEKIVIGTLLAYPHLLKEAGKQCEPEYFSEANSAIATSIWAGNTDSEIAMTLGDSVYEFAQFSDPNALEVAAEKVREGWQIRKEQEAHAKFNQFLKETGYPEASHWLTMERDEIRGKTKKRDPKEIMREKLDARINEAINGGVKTFPIGYEDMTATLGGWHIGEFVAIKAESGMGKTTNLVEFGLRSAKEGTRVLFVSYEMLDVQIGEKAVTMLAGVNQKIYESGHLFDDDIEAIQNAKEELLSMPFSVIDMNTVRATPGSLWNYINTLEKLPEIIILDYLQLMQSDDRAENRNRELEQVSNSLKKMAINTECCILAASQINKEGIMRDAGALKHASHVILSIHREDALKENLNDPGYRKTYITEITVEKHRRHGSIAGQTFQHIFKNGRLVEMDEGTSTVPALVVPADVEEYPF